MNRAVLGFIVEPSYLKAFVVRQHRDLGFSVCVMRVFCI